MFQLCFVCSVGVCKLGISWLFPASWRCSWILGIDESGYVELLYGQALLHLECRKSHLGIISCHGEPFWGPFGSASAYEIQCLCYHITLYKACYGVVVF